MVFSPSGKVQFLGGPNLNTLSTEWDFYARSGLCVLIRERIDPRTQSVWQVNFRPVTAFQAVRVFICLVLETLV